MSVAERGLSRSSGTPRPRDGTVLDLEALSDFVLVATHGGVTQAARASGRPKASLSRRVMELEASLGVRLFERGSRSVRLTEEGDLLLSRTAGPLGEISEAGELLAMAARNHAGGCGSTCRPCSGRCCSAGSQPGLPRPIPRCA